MIVDKYAALYIVISQKLIGAGVIDQEKCDKISRRGHRKHRYWRRHILDLCNITLKSMERDGTFNSYATTVCLAGIKLAKARSNEAKT